ncbi:unnamed protein product [Leuciscus chuanchicus]
MFAGFGRSTVYQTLPVLLVFNPQRQASEIKGNEHTKLKHYANTGEGSFDALRAHNSNAGIKHVVGGELTLRARRLSLSKDKGERLSPKSDHYGPGDGSDNKESTTLSCSTPPLSSQSIHIT